ncbi:MAG: AraC family transcriptional regulator [Firmicutes bacterium]|nr:AraC family transcriptional regulator [Bacillota bacterium]
MMQAASLHQSVLRIDSQMKTMRTLMLQLATDEDYQRLVNKNKDEIDFEVFNRIRRLMRYLASAQYTSLTVNNISIVNCTYNWRLFSDRGMLMIDPAEAQIFRDSAISAGWCREPFYKLNSQFKYVVSGEAFSLTMVGSSDSVIVMQFSNQDFEENLEQSLPGRILYLFDKTNQLIFKEGSKDEAEPSSEENYAFLDQMTGSRGKFELRYEGRKQYFYYEKSEFNGWIYVLREERDTFRRVVLPAMLAMFGSSAIVVTLVGLLAVFFSRRLYQPVQNLYQNVTPITNKNTVDSYDDFDVIVESVQKMLGENRSLNAELEKQHNMLRELVLYRLFAEQMDEEETELLCKQAGINPDQGRMGVIGVTPFSEYQMEPQDDYREWYVLGINEVLINELKSLIVISPIWINNTAAVLLHVDKLSEDYDAYMLQNAENIYETVKTKLGMECRVGYSKSFSKTADISTAFTQVNRMLNDHAGGQNGVISRLTDKQGLNYPYYEEELILKAINDDDLATVKTVLPAFIDKIESLHENPYNKEICYILMLGNLMRLTPEYNVSIIDQASAKLQDSDLIFHILQLPTREKKKDWILTNLIMPIMDLMHRKTNAHRQLIVNTMINYVHNEYQGGLDIEVCATRLNYSAVYLRKVFKDAVGVSFKQYASQFILSKAKTMLAETNIPVMEIAESLGFSNSQNFIRFFRKEEQITPGQYRLEHSGVNGDASES